MNVVSTVSVLPRTPADVRGLYPTDGILPDLSNSVIQDHEINADDTFKEETAGFSEHPASAFQSSGQEQSPSVTRSDNTKIYAAMLEKMGVSDPESVQSSGRSFTASALRNLAGVNPESSLPDLIFHHASPAIREYNNPDLIPGMFPTLFPLGIGGFDDATRPVPLSFDQQAQYYFDISDRSFRYHYSFLFVVFNIWQRRQSHLHTAFTVKSANFESVAKRLTSISSQTLLQVADILEREKTISNPTQEQKIALELLQKVTTVSAQLPGSQAMKIFARNEIRSYSGYFALPQLYLTFNPSPAHSPVFQVMYGDQTVDLSSRFPEMPNVQERALRLAKDPVAAADFFEFSIRALFKYLLGWDYERERSTEKGGILGRIRGFYGTAEFTERGSLHGHFLIWLVGGLNPSDIHAKLKSNPEFENRFFSFFESIIHHHVPEIEVQIDKAYEPRTQRPPVPPSAVEAECLDVMRDWESVFATEVKMCGESLQRHVCGSVCHKYGNEDRCRFLFPHEIVEASHFDPDTNSVVLLCRDATINYFNPYILVFSRHNHDIKCILSGKSAKAAMFYITDYITKMDMKTYQTLTLLSKAVARMPETTNNINPMEAAKTLLHKCLSQFTRQQQIHAQQAARYLRGLNDTISSHRTVPMLSSTLFVYVRGQQENCNADSLDTTLSQSTETEDSNPIEPIPLRLQTDESGYLKDMHQVHHYLYRESTLSEMCFYDFCQRIRIEKKSKSGQLKNTHETRLGVLRRHGLVEPHSMRSTHHLVEHYNKERGEGTHELIPRVIGMSIPREGTNDWYIFTLSHFKPFSATTSVRQEGETWENAFKSYHFSDYHRQIMKNWEAIHECADERDAERLRKREAATAASKAMTNAIYSSAMHVENIDDMAIIIGNARLQHDKNWHIQKFVLGVKQAGWFKPQFTKPQAQPDPSIAQVQNISPISLPPCLPRLSEVEHIPYDGLAMQCHTMHESWKAEIREQEAIIASNRRNAGSSVQNQVLNASQHKTDMSDVSCFSGAFGNLVARATEYGPSVAQNSTMNINIDNNYRIPLHLSGTSNSGPIQQTPAQILEFTAQKFCLNLKQRQSFSIIAQNFIDRCILEKDVKPVRMLMTGPGGTGKTHVVKALKAVMEHYRCGHQIRFLAPTGSAASLIDGMTVHKGLGIKIARSKGKSGRDIGDDTEDYQLIVTVNNKNEIRKEWRSVEVILIDEMSLLSQQLLCDIDHALRYAKERPNDWFGGIIVVFAGDFFQYPPVRGSPMYTPITNKKTSLSEDDFKKRFGRLAWKTVNAVIEMKEQHRMKGDPEYAEIVLRLRTRESTLSDVEFFNTRVIRSGDNPTGIDMGTERNLKSTAIVKTNTLREVLNLHKAEANTQNLSSTTNPDLDANTELIVAAANDVLVTRKTRKVGNSALSAQVHDLSNDDYKYLLDLDLSGSRVQHSLPGFVPLYIGMPVVLRLKNLSTDLKITNGAQGYIRDLLLTKLQNGFMHCSCAIVEFPDSPIKLSGLPKGFYPVVPSKFYFTTNIPMKTPEGLKRTTISICRNQLPIQPAFAVTGHFAQGKGLENLLTSLHEGGFAAYVAASRAINREGLCITARVTLNDLNVPLPHDLFVEHKRLQALEKNTLITYGFEQGDLVPVPDPESEIRLDQKKIRVVPEYEPEKRTLKRKYDNQVSSRTNGNHSAVNEPSSEELEQRAGDITPSQSVKRLKSSVNPTRRPEMTADAPINVSQTGSRLLAGCEWTSENWSCAYDAVFMSLLFAYTSLGEISQNSLKHNLDKETDFKLGKAFHFLSSNPFSTSEQYNQLRDELRDVLSTRDPTSFPRYGPYGASVCRILEILLPRTDQILSIQAHCIQYGCGLTDLGFEESLPTILLMPDNEDGQLDIATLVRRQIVSKTSRYTLHAHVCDHCGTTISEITALLSNKPPVLYFEIPEVVGQEGKIIPSELISFETTFGDMQYKLVAVIYLGGFHFSCRFLDEGVWTYDGQLHKGAPQRECDKVGPITDLLKMGSKKAHIYIYTIAST
ncbi:hypothetical protein CVT24_002642 [Panaeolus cyanescens]|uniref:ATP-dependent DNA helicase n=1 Tax=Panaeolus cyanescens TaxID=181874 RepID=A0A409WB78_9AGAR|nr:hypothetical protein CVT24_002642 [Panaeolus cyanescens]